MSESIGEYRKEFPITKRFAYLDNAATSPIPRRTGDAVQRFCRERMEMAEVAWGKWVEAQHEARRLAAKLMSSQPDEIALVQNTSEGLNIVAHALRWRRGDSVVTSDMEFPSNLYPWLKLKEKGVKVHIVKHRSDGSIRVDDIKRQIDERTKLVAISHVQYGNGFKIDLKSLREVTDGRCLLCVDAIQSLGAVEVNSRFTDFLSAGGHKWLLSPIGIGVFYVDRRIELDPPFVSWSSVEEPEAFLPTIKYAKTARRFECGLRSLSGVYGLVESLKLLLKVGIPGISKRILELTDLVIDGAEELRIPIQTPLDPSKRAGIVNLRVKQPEKLVRSLLKKKVVVSARMSGLRVSPHFYNNGEDIDALLKALKEQ